MTDIARKDGQFPGKNGVLIYWQSWLPARPKAVVVIVHGLGEHGGRYAHVAEALVEADLAVYAVDHRGHGKSGGTRTLIDRFANAVADIDQLVDLARKAHPNKPVIVLGHSMGGALSLSYALKHGDKLRALALSGPAIALDAASPMVLLMAKIMSVVAPKVGSIAIDPSLVSRDPQMVAAYASDPLNAHGKVPVRTVAEIVKFVEWIPAALQFLTLPLLVQHGSEDKLAGVDGSRMLVSKVGSQDKTLKVYDGLYHEIFNELPADREKVIGDLRDWIVAHV